MIILDATLNDAKQILDIYSYYIENTAITFEEVVPSIEEFENRIKTISSKYPYLVLKENDRILGFAYANTFHEREAYRFCAELSIYVDFNYRHKGYGKLLYSELEKRLKERNFTNLYACIAYCDHEDPYLDNNSVLFHQHIGYKQVADFKNCGYKFNTWYHMTYLEKIIGPHTKNQKEIVTGMKKKYFFRQATLQDLDRIQELIDQRIAWMDKVGIKQWNVTKYNERYPRSYYIEHLPDFYVLTDHDKVVCAGTLYKEDDRWNKEGSAYYIHHLVSEIGYKDLGYKFLDHALIKAREDRMEYLRLDSAIDNEKLKEYYTNYGFKPVGTCIDGLYEGILREIKL